LSRSEQGSKGASHKGSALNFTLADAAMEPKSVDQEIADLRSDIKPVYTERMNLRRIWIILTQKSARQCETRIFRKNILDTVTSAYRHLKKRVVFAKHLHSESELFSVRTVETSASSDEDQRVSTGQSPHQVRSTAAALSPDENQTPSSRQHAA
jgi:hypothetical protein